METFILYLYICAGAAQCHWMANGEFNASKEMVSAPNASIPMLSGKTLKSSAKEMCELAAKQLQLKDGEWKCISSGLHPMIRRQY